MATLISSKESEINSIEARIAHYKVRIAMIQPRLDYLEEKIRKLDIKKEIRWDRHATIPDPVTEDFGRINLKDFENIVIKQYLFKKEKHAIISDIKKYQDEIAKLSRV